MVTVTLFLVGAVFLVAFALGEDRGRRNLAAQWHRGFDEGFASGLARGQSERLLARRHGRSRTERPVLTVHRGGGGR